MEKIDKITSLLPGFNCSACGSKNCYEFAAQLVAHHAYPDECVVLLQERFATRRKQLSDLLLDLEYPSTPLPTGLIDHVEADFQLHPLINETSCRETLACFASVTLAPGMIIRYRPLGCPITHFGQVIEVNYGLPDVWVVGPASLLGRTDEAVGVGICMVLSFQGRISGNRPSVGQTVKFLPAHCMMGKVHSGIIVHLEDDHCRIDCIDLKVWEHASLVRNNSLITP